MPMVLLTINLQDPISGASKVVQRQVDPLAFDLAAWDRVFLDVQQTLTDLQVSGPSDPVQL